MRGSIYSMSFAAVLLVVGSVGVPQDTASDDTSEAVKIQFTLAKRVYPRAERNTFLLDVQCDGPGLSVYATCDLRKDTQGVGRFPLRQMEVDSKTNATRFTVACLSRDFVDESVIHVLVRDDATGKGVGGLTVRLKDAKVAKTDRTKP